MADFLYYIPGKTSQITNDDLCAMGLGYTFANAVGTTERPECRKGPDGAAGVIVSGPGMAVGKSGYYPTSQTWREYDGMWVGHWNDARPTPQTLLRANALNGHPVTLGGVDWIIPVARQINDDHTFTCALPTVIRWDKTGKWVCGDVVERYGELWKLAQDYWDVLWKTEPDATDDGGVEIRFKFDEANDAAVMAMQVNYRISPREIDLLELFQIDSASKILNALVDFPSFLAIVQKKSIDALTADGSTSSDGQED